MNHFPEVIKKLHNNNDAFNNYTCVEVMNMKKLELFLIYFLVTI